VSTKHLLRVCIDAAYAGKSVLRDVRLEIEPGEVLGLVGLSGAGKSTLVLALLGLLPWRGGRVTGEVMLEGKNLLQMSEQHLRELRGHLIAVIPQSPMSALNPAISLERHFREAWLAHRGNDKEAFRQRVRDLLREVQLPSDSEFLLRRPSQVSVGQAQRVLIALALLHDPMLIIADEPTSALDPLTQIQILDLLKKLNRDRGTALLYVSHDLVSVLQLSRRMAVLDAGTLVETLPVNELNRASHPTTMALLNALPAPPDVLLGYRNLGSSEGRAAPSSVSKMLK
jgi:peptide/nickel transport system ATP-binding protein